MKKLLGLFFIVILVGGAIGGYLGFIPGLSSLLGTDKPKDFGIRYTLEDSTNAQTKSGVIIKALPPETPASQSFVLSGSKPLEITMDQQELTALVNNRPWRYYPFESVQIRINPDGSVEASGILNAENILSYASALGFKTDDVRKAMSDYHIPMLTMPFYAKASGGVIDNKVSLSIESVQAGKIPVPKSILTSNTGRVVEVLDSLITRLSGVNVESLTFTGGKMNFKGTVPETESVVMK